MARLIDELQGMVIKELKEAVLNDMDWLCSLRDIVKEKGKSVETITELKKMKHDGFFVEVESDITGETDAPWIRLNFDVCYLFICDDGTEMYQLDPAGCYGDELIDVGTYDEFVAALDKVGDEILSCLGEEW